MTIRLQVLALLLTGMTGNAVAQEQPRAYATVQWTVLERQATKRMEPKCPVEQLPSGTPGFVLVQLIVGRDGKVRMASGYAGADALIGTASEALKQWEFVPQTINGEPVEVQTMAQLQVCKEVEPPPDLSSLNEVRTLVSVCRDPGEEGAESACKKAADLANALGEHDRAIGKWESGLAWGEFLARNRRYDEAHKVLLEGLEWMRSQPRLEAMQLQFLWRLGEVNEVRQSPSQALKNYQDAEHLMRTAMEKLEGRRAQTPENTYRDVRAGQLRHIRRALEGQVRALTALQRDAEADELRVKLAQLE